MSDSIRPLIKAIAIDVTGYCNGLPPAIDRVLDVYVYDDNRNVNLCSFTPSVELWHAYGTWEAADGDLDDAAVEEADEWVREAGRFDEAVIYMDRSSVERLVATREDYSDTYGPCGPAEPYSTDEEYDQQYRELIEEAIEYYRGNPPW